MSRFGALGATVLCGAVFAACTTTRSESIWVLPLEAEASFQAVIRDANEGGKLGDSVSVTNVRIDAERATVSLRRAAPPATAQVVLEHPATGHGDAPRWFAMRPLPEPPPEALVPAIRDLGTLLDAHFPSDPWTVASLPPPDEPPRGRGEPGVTSSRTRSRLRVLGGAVIVAILSLSLLVWLWVDKPEE